MTEKTSPDTQTSQSLLREAATLIDAALRQLDTRKTKCSDCGTRIFENFEHGKTHQQFADIPRKLRDAADRLDVKYAHPRPNDGAIE